MLVAVRDETPARDLPDELLAARSDDDLDAFTELYNRYLCRVYRFVRSQTPDKATAEDLTAHTFFRALSGARSFKGHGSYRSWLLRAGKGKGGKDSGQGGGEDHAHTGRVFVM